LPSFLLVGDAAPAPRFAVCVDGAGMGHAGADVDERKVRVDLDRYGLSGSGGDPVAEATVGLVAPAPRFAICVDRAGVSGPDGDVDEPIATGYGLWRGVHARRLPVTQPPILCETPTSCDPICTQRAGVVVSRFDHRELHIGVDRLRQGKRAGRLPVAELAALGVTPTPGLPVYVDSAAVGVGQVQSLLTVLMAPDAAPIKKTLPVREGL